MYVLMVMSINDATHHGPVALCLVQLVHRTCRPGTGVIAGSNDAKLLNTPNESRGEAKCTEVQGDN